MFGYWDCYASAEIIIMSHKTIQEVLAENTARWMEIPGVVAVGQGLHRSGTSIVILTDTEPESVRKQTGESVDGYRIRVLFSGEIEAREA